VSICIFAGEKGREEQWLADKLQRHDKQLKKKRQGT